MAVRFTQGDEQLTLFTNHSGMVGNTMVWLGDATRHYVCGIDQFYGSFELFLATTP